ncbi:MAG TPA: AMP-binding protein [Acidimicrobiia bacterium]
MLTEWIRSHPPSRPFLISGEGTLTYGDLLAAGAPDGPGQHVVVPDGTLESVVRLMTSPGNGRQLVLIDPSCPVEEKRRRREVAASAAGQAAATILFTSGTTGPAKAVRLTAGNWEAAARASAAHLNHTPDDVWLAAMPLHHVGGLSILYRSAFVGAAVRWLPRFEVTAVAEAMRGDVTIVSVVPTMLRRLLDHDDGLYRDLKAVLVGGGPIPPGLLEEAHSRGIPALPTYGMTETCAQVATLRPGSRPRYAAHPLPGIDVRVVGERIHLRGAQISPGYVGEADRSPEDWFVTPDRGVLDEDGALRLLGRVDRVVVTGGENVDPGRVESILASHPGVEAAALVGVPDPEWGERLVGVYVGAAEPASLRAWAAERLAPYEVPRDLRRVEEMPLAGGGKPDLDAVRALF